MSAGNNGQVIWRCQANGAVTNRQALKITGDASGIPDVATATAATDKVIGFALEDAADNAIFAVCVSGPCEAIASGAITWATDEFLTPAADGELTPYAVGNRPVAYFMGAKDGSLTAGANDIIDVVVIRAPIDTIV